MAEKKANSTGSVVVGGLFLVALIVGGVLLAGGSLVWLAEHVTRFALTPNVEDALWALINILTLIAMDRLGKAILVLTSQRK